MAIAANPGGATLGGTTSVGTVNGVATFSDLSIDKVGTNYTLAASSAGLTGVTSSAFNINNPAPTISSISPDHACTGQILNVIVTGSGFISGVTTVSVNMSQNISIVTTVNSPTQLTATFTIGSNVNTGSRNFMATNGAPGGGTANVNSGFTIGTTNCPPSTFAISASGGSGGSISLSGPVTVNSGANQTFTITPDTGYHVADVLVDGSSVGAVTTYTFTNVTANHTIAASFTINTYAIAASAGANGSISPSGNVLVTYGANQTFTITPDTGYHVADVLVDGSSVGAVTSYTFTNVTANHTVAASFAINTYSIAASAGATGNITPSGNVSVTYGANRTFTITPDTGYHVADVLVDGSSVGAVISYTFTNVTVNHTIAASSVDATPPDTTVDSGPTSPTNATTATFMFSGTDNVTAPANLTFECKLNGSAFAPCSSPAQYTVVDGSHTFQVRAIDQAHNPDPTPASFTWTVDTQAPDTVIDSAPADPTNSNTATFTFHGDLAGGDTFQCQLDGQTPTACNSGTVTYSGLAAGEHLFTVAARDAAGNTDQSAASFAWTIDVTPPDTTISSGPSDGSSTTNTSASFDFEGLDNLTATGALSFECSLDGGAFSSCTSPVLYSGLSRTSHTFAVRAKDQAGNVDPTPATATWTITKIEPVITWATPADITYPMALSNTQLNATADVAGSFLYTPASGTILTAGNNQALKVDFTPNDSVNYNTATKTVSINVLKGTPVITWANPADITYPTLLSGTQLTATADVAGSFVYTPAAGTQLNASPGQALKVDLTPADAANYNTATKTVSINVLKGTPVITWANPADITYPTLLSGTQLNATADVAGSFVYTPAAGTKLNANPGQALKVDFTPADAANYNTATKTASIDVVKGAPGIPPAHPPAL